MPGRVTLPTIGAKTTARMGRNVYVSHHKGEDLKAAAQVRHLKSGTEYASALQPTLEAMA
jgi:hypothetical protein